MIAEADPAVQVKVADFGMSRLINEKHDYYHMSGSSDKAVPIRWTAPEALQFAKFSQKSGMIESIIFSIS